MAAGDGGRRAAAGLVAVAAADRGSPPAGDIALASTDGGPGSTSGVALAPADDACPAGVGDGVLEPSADKSEVDAVDLVAVAPNDARPLDRAGDHIPCADKTRGGRDDVAVASADHCRIADPVLVAPADEGPRAIGHVAFAPGDGGPAPAGGVVVAAAHRGPDPAGGISDAAAHRGPVPAGAVVFTATHRGPDPAGDVVDAAAHCGSGPAFSPPLTVDRSPLAVLSLPPPTVAYLPVVWTLSSSPAWLL